MGVIREFLIENDLQNDQVGDIVGMFFNKFREAYLENLDLDILDLGFGKLFFTAVNRGAGHSFKFNMSSWGAEVVCTSKHKPRSINRFLGNDDSVDINIFSSKVMEVFRIDKSETRKSFKEYMRA